MKCLSLTYSTVNFVRSENTPGLRCSILFDFIHLRKNVYLSFQLVKKKKKRTVTGYKAQQIKPATH